jgi:DNA-binding transcriptional LysR family regulator
MLEGPDVSLDQLRLLVAIADTGSFSAAGRRLGRVQSAVSHAVARAEEELGVTLFDRSTRRPTVTDAGQAVIRAAREALASAADVGMVARSLREGFEAEVSIVFDAIFPTEALADLARLFADNYPTVGLRLGTETLSAVSTAVEQGRYTLGVCGPVAPTGDDLEVDHIGTVRMMPVAGPEHPLAQQGGRLSARDLGRHTQIVLSERAGVDVQSDGVDDVAVMSGRTWRVVDLPTKQVLLRRHLGWGNLPEHMARPDIDAGLLVPLQVKAWGPDEHLLGMRAVYRRAEPLGPAAAWVLSLLPGLCRARSAGIA